MALREAKLILFTEPLYLLLLIPAVLGLVLSFRHIHGMAPVRKKLAFFLRFVVASCIIIAIAGPEAKRENQGTAVVFLVDRSDSISQADRQKEEKYVTAAVAALKPNDQAAVVLFGADARLESGMDGARALPPLTSLLQSTSTDIAGAIRLGSAIFPDGKGRRLVLLTDGNETQGDASGAAEVSAADKVPIDIVALGGDANRPEAAIDAVETPSEASADRPFEMRIVVDSTVEQQGRIVVDRDDKPLKTLSVQLHKGKTAVVVQDSIPDAGFHRYRASLEASPRYRPEKQPGTWLCFRPRKTQAAGPARKTLRKSAGKRANPEWADRGCKGARPTANST